MERLPGEPGKSIARINKNTDTWEHFCSPAHPSLYVKAHTYNGLGRFCSVKEDLTRELPQRPNVSPDSNGTSLFKLQFSLQ